MKQRFSRLLFTVFMMLVTAAGYAVTVTIDGICYNLSGTNASVAFLSGGTTSYYSAYKGNVVIPSTVVYNGKTYNVTSIDYNAFYHSESLISVEIPSSVTEIRNEAFKYCSSLTSIDIPSSVTEIGNEAFEYCSSLTSIDIPSSVTMINVRAFSGCSSLTTIKIPSSVTSIIADAFAGCSSLSSIEIPSSVTSIGNYAFAGCSSLSSIYISDLGAWCNISMLSNLMQYGSPTKKLYINGEEVKDVVIPYGVKVIQDLTFKCFTNIKSVNIPLSVTSIATSAFEGCSSLSSIEIPSSVTSIGTFAFEGCSSLSSIEIPSSVTSIGTSAFEGCYSLSSIEIPSSVISIGDAAFAGCYSLPTIKIPSSVISIGKGAFSDCSSLAFMAIPSSVTSIDERAFSYCSSLSSITIPLSVTTIGNSAFWGCCSLSSVEIPSNVTSIGDNALNNCSSLTRVTMYAVPKSVGYNALPTATTIYVPQTNYEAAKAKFPDNAVVVLVNHYTIEVTSDDNTMGIVTGAGEYEEEAQVTLTAIPAEGYEFVQWSDGATENPYTFTATENKKLTAIFQEIVVGEPTAPDLSELAHAIYADETQALVGTGIVLPLRLKNTASITSFQFDLRLPEGVTIATDSYGDADIQLATERTTLARHSLSYNEQANGDIRVVCTSLKNATFTGNDGNVVLVRLNIAEGMEEGNYPIVLSNIEMAEPDMTKHKVSLYTSTLHIDDYVIGDVDGDREVTVTDVTGVVNIILGIPMTNANEKAADVSGDGEVTVTDATGVVNIILGIPNGSSARRALRTTEAALNIAPFSVIAGETVEVPIVLQSGADEFTSMQFDLVLPAGLRLIDATADRRHNADFATSCEGTERIVSLSLSNATYAGNGTAALTLTLAADSDVEGGHILLDGIELVRPELSNVRLDALSAPFAVAGTTGVEALNAGTAANTIYDLQGRKTRGAVKGVYMQNEQKVIK